jgi:hypothetical protein
MPRKPATHDDPRRKPQTAPGVWIEKEWNMGESPNDERIKAVRGAYGGIARHYCPRA